MATKNDKAGKGKLVTIRFAKINKQAVRVSTPGHHSRTGAQTCNNRRKAHGKLSKHR